MALFRNIWLKDFPSRDVNPKWPSSGIYRSRIFLAEMSTLNGPLQEYFTQGLSKQRGQPEMALYRNISLRDFPGRDANPKWRSLGIYRPGMFLAELPTLNGALQEYIAQLAGTKLAQNFREKWLLPAGKLGRSDCQIGRSYSTKLRHFLSV